MTEWRSVLGFEDVYEVSDDGQVRRIAPGPMTTPGRVLKPRLRRKGYRSVVLHYLGQQREATVHRLVAEAFLPAPTTRQTQVNHIDGDKANNCARNLEWATPERNMQHSHDMGLHVALKGEQHVRAKLTAEQVLKIRASGDGDRVLAAQYGVAKSLIWAIRARRIWRSLGEATPTDLRSAP